ncbi:hypothetical protein CIB93_30025 [Streptomyces sp. WZ.A104]|uniref:Uncharacterized protein n=1 Tax=Streptomyces durocortorensis TaxID=2811104 RepID=A0ABY9VY60_9ACTN|nr:MULTISPECIES: hypothetical protein [Streptomyces]PCG82466.1 hypothetical protein CIB93_30025 [Streptomyces sp. WZ.A104]WNF25951.1 hypothetical protein RI138_03550 [Streptomyces durocortorensis]
MGAGDTEHHNSDELYNVQNRTGDLDGLGQMRSRFVEIASVDGVFGTVANGAAAEAALAGAASAMLAELERAGISVDNIAGNAGTAGEIADMTDEEAAFQQKLAQSSGGGQFQEVR